LPIEGARLEGLALQRGVEHEQAHHANPEKPDQDKKKRKSSQMGGRLGHGPEGLPCLSAVVVPGDERCPERAHPATAISEMRTAARSRADAARGLRAISAGLGLSAPRVNSRSSGLRSAGTTGRSRGARS
jgi:hypothetical protein